MNSNALRELFLDYFLKQGHTIVPSSSLIPTNDSSLLFTNAGMVPFKDVFLGLEKRAYDRASSVQRCLRAGGKHNDLENVGYTARHHTFFEMLGNFSFGDYFKREAILYSWKFLTEYLNITPERLWITVFSEDQETEAIWLNEMNIDPTRFSRCGESDNFWAMGDTGPCGPCTEIFYDYGPNINGGPPGSTTADGDRYVEIWNLVFMQFQRSASGALTPLPRPSVDTGMGLERLAAVMQGVTNNYDTDLFQPLIKTIAQEAGIRDLKNTSLRVIADHIRSCVFLISDGVIPGNEGRSYVLRRIMRRAIRHGHKIGLDRPFFYRLVQPLAQQMHQPYPELASNTKFIEGVIFEEEQQFARTLTQGMKLFEQEAVKLNATKQLPGEVLFRLYDTYGFPVDLTADIARELGLTIDMIGFTNKMEHQRNQSRAASQFVATPVLSSHGTLDTEFTGYQELAREGATVVGLFKASEPVTALLEDDEGYIVLDRTPFYPEGGGQIGDTGRLSTEHAEFLVCNTLKEGNRIFHQGRLVKGSLKHGDKINATVDCTQRHATALNHSATHLLHAALRQVLGEHVVQKGSLVEPDRLRFDFSFQKPLSSETLQIVENRVNEAIRTNSPVITEIMLPEEARQVGALAIFGEKYGDSVRVLTMGDFSKELCGGTHVLRTGDIGLFKIIDERGIAAGIRRIQAVTGQSALNWVMLLEGQTKQLAKLFKVSRTHLVEKAQSELTEKRALQKQIEALQRSIVSMMGDELIAQAIEIHGIRLLITEINGLDAVGLRYLLMQLKDNLQHAVIVLASSEKGRVQLMVSVAKELCNQIKANELVHAIGPSIGGQGGGGPDFAQVGGDHVMSLEATLKKARLWIETRLSSPVA